MLLTNKAFRGMIVHVQKSLPSSLTCNMLLLVEPENVRFKRYNIRNDARCVVGNSQCMKKDVLFARMCLSFLTLNIGHTFLQLY
jgi:hypothetical protein